MSVLSILNPNSGNSVGRKSLSGREPGNLTPWYAATGLYGEELILYYCHAALKCWKMRSRVQILHSIPGICRAVCTQIPDRNRCKQKGSVILYPGQTLAETSCGFYVQQSGV